jgi:hypothetical protein
MREALSLFPAFQKVVRKQTNISGVDPVEDVQFAAQ